MEVHCEICKKKTIADECWCVIDTRKHIRYFECKVKCKPPAPPLPPPLPPSAPPMEPFELDIVDNEDEDPTETVLVEDWIAKPRFKWIEWMKDLFGVQSYRYVKVKTS